MDKTAQRRGLKGVIDELSPTAIGGRAAEKFFAPEFERVMNSLRKNDAKIRAIATGQSIEGADPGPDPIALKDLLKSAKSFLNRREYMSAVADLGRFHNKMISISKILSEVNLDIDKVHHEFLFKDLNEERKRQLSSLKSRFAAEQAMLTKEASIMDFFVNIGTPRGRSLAAWEKRYPQKVSKLKKDTHNLLISSTKVFDKLIEQLKAMSSARAARNPDAYLQASKKINALYVGYNEGFKTYYNENVKEFLDKLGPDILPQNQAPGVNVGDAKEMGEQVVPGFKPAIVGTPGMGKEVVPGPSGIELQEQPKDTIPSPPPDFGTGSTPVVQPQAPLGADLMAQIPGNTRDTVEPPSPQAPAPRNAILPPKMTHRTFYQELESLSNESPLMLAKFIRKYAVNIQFSDPETSIELLKIVRSIKE